MQLLKTIGSGVGVASGGVGDVVTSIGNGRKSPSGGRTSPSMAAMRGSPTARVESANVLRELFSATHARDVCRVMVGPLVSAGLESHDKTK